MNSILLFDVTLISLPPGLSSTSCQEKDKISIKEPVTTYNIIATICSLHLSLSLSLSLSAY